jgi:hypothetical protein
MRKGFFNQAFRLVPKIASVESDSSRRVIIESKPSYSEQAACVVLGAEMAKLRQMRQDGLIRSDVPDEFTEEQLRALHAEVRALRAEGKIE